MVTNLTILMTLKINIVGFVTNFTKMNQKRLRNEMSSLEHLHIYERIKDRPEFYRCIHPLCSHYAKKTMIMGKTAACKCGTEYLLDNFNLVKKTPKCPGCTKGRIGRSKLQTGHNVSKLLGDLSDIANESDVINNDNQDKSFEL